ncbi:N-methyl-D-aspartate receptor-associated protein [Cryptosporidium ryanae]|uniref:N-methyl-D-aspartate receptor-associated protein n=1 Tax=Cryptosporidium ryanae TaxID=515981 RepID=UPI003519F635|nr:N-methyl-D-aspartate receptor-associated protein [Cryptosporidium ryanae]
MERNLEACESATLDNLYLCDFETKVRHGFIRRVYGLLSINLAITFGIVLFFSFYNAASIWLFENYWISILSSILSLIIIIITSFCPGIAKNHYYGFIILNVLSLLFGITVSALAICVEKVSVLISCGITVLIFIFLTFFALQVKYDFTGWGPYLLIGVLILFIYGIVLIFVPRSNIAYTVFGGIGVSVFSFYIIYDTQKIVGGKHRKFQFGTDDYIFATISLYLDIIYVFTYILTIFGSLDR